MALGGGAHREGAGKGRASGCPARVTPSSPWAPSWPDSQPPLLAGVAIYLGFSQWNWTRKMAGDGEGAGHGGTHTQKGPGSLNHGVEETSPPRPRQSAPRESEGGKAATPPPCPVPCPWRPQNTAKKRPGTSEAATSNTSTQRHLCRGLSQGARLHRTTRPPDAGSGGQGAFGTGLTV